MLAQGTPSKYGSKTAFNNTVQKQIKSQMGINKLLQKDLKQLIFNLDYNQLITLFRNLQIEINSKSTKQFSKIGLKCNQCHIIFQSFHSKGYGRDQHQALINSIKIILQSMISSSFKIQSIKKALKYCSKFKQPLINSSQTINSSNQSGNYFPPTTPSIISSTKKSMKKVQGLDHIKFDKKHLQYPRNQDSSNKQNRSKMLNQTLDLNSSEIEQKIIIDSKQINLDRQKKLQSSMKIGLDRAIKQEKNVKRQRLFSEQKTIKQCNGNYTSTDNRIYQLQDNFDKKVDQNSINQKKCSTEKDCLYYEIHKHSQNQIKNLSARIKLLQEQNSMLKQLLLKDFNKEFFSKNQKLLKQNKHLNQNSDKTNTLRY